MHFVSLYALQPNVISMICLHYLGYLFIFYLLLDNHFGEPFTIMYHLLMQHEHFINLTLTKVIALC